MSKDKYLKLPQSSRIPDEQIKSMFKDIYQGRFEELDQFEGLIILGESETLKTGLPMVKDNDGLWKMDYIEKI